MLDNEDRGALLWVVLVVAWKWFRITVYKHRSMNSFSSPSCISRARTVDWRTLARNHQANCNRGAARLPGSSLHAGCTGGATEIGWSVRRRLGHASTGLRPCRSLSSVGSRQIAEFGRMIVAPFGGDYVEVVTSVFSKLTGLLESRFRGAPAVHKFAVLTHTFDSKRHTRPFFFSFFFFFRALA